MVSAELMDGMPLRGLVVSHTTLQTAIIHIELWKITLKILPKYHRNTTSSFLEYSAHPIYFQGIVEGKYVV
jgi:hypothetical protein